MLRYAATIPGPPRPKQRVRGGQGRFYTQRETEEYELAVAWAVKAAMRQVPPLEGPVVMGIVALEGFSGATRRKDGSLTAKALRCLRGEEPPKQRPDLDNVVKAILDGANEVAFKDDRQVCGFLALRAYATKPRVEVVIVPVTHPKGAARALVYLASHCLRSLFLR